MTFLRHIQSCNTADMRRFRPFEVAGAVVGWILPSFARHLAAFPDVFAVDERRVALHPRFNTAADRTRIMRETTQRLTDAGALPKARGEGYAVVTEWGREPLFTLDRGFVSAFGVQAFGVHANGIVRDGARFKLWIGRRAADKPVAPLKLDNMVAGGQPIGLSAHENLVKECAEEADIPREMALRAVPVGAITYRMEAELGLRPDTLFVYDLAVPPDFTPRNTDGEICEFMLMDLDEVAERVRETDDFKFNVNLVIIDLLIRHGRLTADNEPDYTALVRGLRSPL
jgi:hypothetical protein